MFCWMALEYQADPAFLLGTMSWANFSASSKKIYRFVGGLMREKSVLQMDGGAQPSSTQ